jgi:hypothetical protein
MRGRRVLVVMWRHETGPRWFAQCLFAVSFAPVSDPTVCYRPVVMATIGCGEETPNAISRSGKGAQVGRLHVRSSHRSRSFGEIKDAGDWDSRNRGKTTGTGYRALPNASDQVNNTNKILVLAPIRRGAAEL